MAYFSRLADMSFRKDLDGNIVFFPWGYFGKGYTLSDTAHEEKIRRSIIKGNIIGLSLVLILGVILKLWIVAFVLFPFVILFWWLFVKRYTRGLEISAMEYSLSAGIESATTRIDNSTRSLRIAIVVQWILLLASVSVGLFEERYLPELLKNYINEQDSKTLSSGQMVVMGSALLLLLTVIISSISLFLLKPWARGAYVACSVLGAVLFLFMGPTVMPPIGGTLHSLVNATEGFIIALLYFSSARINFDNSNQNAREGR